MTAGMAGHATPGRGMIVALEMIGVELDEARNEEVALEILRRTRHVTGASRTSKMRPSRTTSVPSTTSSGSTMRALVKMVWLMPRPRLWSG